MSAHDLALKLRHAPPLNDPRALCTALGLHEGARWQARGALIRCPAHDDRSPSCSVFRAKDDTVAAKCHGCGWSGDALGLVAIVRGLDVRKDWRRVLDEATRLVGRDVRELEARAIGTTPPRNDRDARDATYDAIVRVVLELCSPLRGIAPDVFNYLDTRGVFADADAVGVRGLPGDCRRLVAALLATFERTQLEDASVLRQGQDAIDLPAWPLLIPWRDRYGRITCLQRRRLDGREPRYRFPRGRAPRAPFGVDLLGRALDAIGPDGEVVVVEGALDCLARRRIARHREERAAVLGVYSATSPCVGLPLDLLAGRRVVLALDDDQAGERACAALLPELRPVARDLVRERPMGMKDWNATIAEASR